MTATATSSGPTLTFAHDYFTQRGGAERVAAGLIDRLRPNRVIAALHDPIRTYSLPIGTVVETTGLQRVPLFRREPRWALLLLPLVWRRLPVVTEGVLLCSSAGWSHQLRAATDVAKVVYCHDPARWLYQADEYLRDARWPVRALSRAIAPWLRWIDRHAARTADVYLANSTAVASRIERAYGIEAAVVHPPVTIDPAGSRIAVDLPWQDFFLTVGRKRGYKNTRLLVEAFDGMPEINLVVIGAEESDRWPSNVHVIADISEAQLRWLYAHASALVSVSDEDFGLTPIEANLFGTPALVLRAGGFLDSLDEGVSGSYVEFATIASIRSAVGSFAGSWDRDLIRAHAQRFSMDRFVEQLQVSIDLAVARRTARQHLGSARTATVEVELHQELPLA